ncbi:hypothetical protein TNCV_3644911 [Trichonephila clavipes]|nr:hypothetical protein TNCV_3644911 [Trichonephila clavipes]
MVANVGGREPGPGTQTKTLLEHHVYLQPMSSRVNIRDNAITDRLAKEGSENETATVALRLLIKNCTLMQNLS